MMNRIEQFADNLKSESRLLADRAVSGLRTAGLETAGLISRSKGPVDAFADTALKFNKQSHKRIEQMLKQQVKILDSIIDESAGRIEKVAKAKDVADLKDVIELDFSGFGAKKAPARKKTAAKKRSTKKASAKKRAAKKSTAKKRTTRKASARKASTKKAAASKGQAA